MTDIESRVNELERRQTGFEVRFDMYMQKTDELIRLQRERMDKFEEKHDADMARIDAKMDKLADKIDGLVKYVQSMAITSMIGLLGIAGSVVYFVYSVTPKP